AAGRSPDALPRAGVSHRPRGRCPDPGSMEELLHSRGGHRDRARPPDPALAEVRRGWLAGFQVPRGPRSMSVYKRGLRALERALQSATPEEAKPIKEKL